MRFYLCVFPIGPVWTRNSLGFLCEPCELCGSKRNQDEENFFSPRLSGPAEGKRFFWSVSHDFLRLHQKCCGGQIFYKAGRGLKGGIQLMAVITKFFVVRNGLELDKVFTEKKDAEAYDKMLDAAEQLAEFIKKGELECGLDDESINEISVFLAKNGPEVTRILKTVKPIAKARGNQETAKPGETQEQGGKKQATPKQSGKKDK
jgi:dsDNA-binding SOS-regulon protein